MKALGREWRKWLSTVRDCNSVNCERNKDTSLRISDACTGQQNVKSEASEEQQQVNHRRRQATHRMPEQHEDFGEEAKLKRGRHGRVNNLHWNGQQDFGED